MSKLNPQNATAYVGPGVLRKGGKITKVPNGPLIKKTGKFKGSTLKAGGRIKKAENGVTTTAQTTEQPTVPLSPYMQKRADQKVKNTVRLAPFEASQQKKYANWKNSDSKNINKTYEDWQKELVKGQQGENAPLEGMRTIGKDDEGCAPSPKARKKRLEKEAKRKNGGPIKKAKSGAMLKRADGSTSKRGLWDNIRKNKGSGKKPTKQMLVQEKKIKAKTKK